VITLGELDLGFAAGVTIRGEAGNDRIDASLLTHAVTLIGGDGHDTLLGGRMADSLDGGAGKDLLNGRAGNDTLMGGTANDRLFGGRGSDRLDGGRGHDLLKGQGTRFDTLDGGPGDTIRSTAVEATMNSVVGSDTTGCWEDLGATRSMEATEMTGSEGRAEATCCLVKAAGTCSTVPLVTIRSWVDPATTRSLDLRARSMKPSRLSPTGSQTGRRRSKSPPAQRSTRRPRPFSLPWSRPECILFLINCLTGNNW